MKFKEDSYYIDQVLNGNTAAYSFLVEKHKSLVYSIALKILSNPDDAEEIAQDAFLKAYQSLKSFEKKSKFSTWLYRIVYNAAISKTRKKKLEYVSLDGQLVENYTEDEVMAATGKYDEQERAVLVNRALEKLSEDENLLVALFYKGENSVEEISYITGLSVSNVKVRLFRIRKKLYDILNEMMKMN